MGNWGFCKFLHFLSDKSFKKIEKKRGDISKLELTVTLHTFGMDSFTKISKMPLEINVYLSNHLISAVIVYIVSLEFKSSVS